MKPVKTPCIGICSTTSLGDPVCRGCKRYSFEVIRWNAYGDEEKAAVLRRIEKLICQILEHKTQIYSVSKLRTGLEAASVPFDTGQSPYCWLHNLLKKQHQNIESLNVYGATVLPEYSALTLAELSELIDEELLQLCQAHFDRYYELPISSKRA